MSIDQSSFSSVLSDAEELDLVSRRETDEVMRLFGPGFPFGNVLTRADSVHVHVRVDDVAQLPHDRLRAVSLGAENAKDGYIKYPCAGGINLIFSSIPVSDDDLLTDYPQMHRPFMDHLGIDVRDESDVSRKLFDAVPDTAADLGWRHVPQGGEGQDVFCCHTAVSGKHWVYPGADDESFTRPIEFAFGELKISAGEMGCDLRPIDPAHPRAGSVPACGAHGDAADEATAPGNGAARTTYYDPKDLGKFADVGANATGTMDKFWAYYTAATGTDSALSKREKSLIGLAVAHSKQCPYCIEAYTAQCLDTGSNAEEMHEALHVAAALSAGIDLVHGVQMRNVLHARGAI